MAGSLKPSGSPSVDTQQPTSGSVGRAGSVQSPTTQDRRSPLVSSNTVISHMHELRAAYVDTISGFPLTVKILESVFNCEKESEAFSIDGHACTRYVYGVLCILKGFIQQQLNKFTVSCWLYNATSTKPL